MCQLHWLSSQHSTPLADSFADCDGPIGHHIPLLLAVSFNLQLVIFSPKGQHIDVLNGLATDLTRVYLVRLERKGECGMVVNYALTHPMDLPLADFVSNAINSADHLRSPAGFIAD